MDRKRKAAYTTDEAAARLGVNAATLRRWVHDQQLPVCRVGRVFMIPAAGLDKWLREVYPRLQREGKVRRNVVRI